MGQSAGLKESRFRKDLKIINHIIQRIGLELSDLVLLTEIASENFIYTPFIAGLAGAKRVFAFTKDTHYSPAENVIRDGERLIKLSGLDDIQVITDLTPEIISNADLITNMGLLRPIDKGFIANMKETAVIPLMYVSWELRKTDVDLDACMQKGIPVMGTNESHPLLDVFDYCGLLALKLCFDAGLEIKGNKIAIYSNDAFGDIIGKYLMKNGAEVRCFDQPENIDVDFISESDAIITAQMNDPRNIFNWDPIKENLVNNPRLKVIQYIGIGDIEALSDLHIELYPPRTVEKHRMAFTFNHLGPLPVIQLIAGGLKVGEIMARMRLSGNSPSETILKASKNLLCQKI